LANLKPWWERWPGRLENELAELDSSGVQYERDEALWARGHLRLRLAVPDGAETVPLVADFPATYPYFRVEIAGDDLQLPHHQDPYGKTLCLFGRDTGEWSPSFTLARVVRDRLPLVLEAGRTADPAVAANLEQHQAEPVTDYFPYAPGGMLLVDSTWDLGRKSAGQLLVRIDPGAWPLRGAVALVRSDGERLAEASPDLLRAYPGPLELQARWVRLPLAPDQNEPAAVLDAVAQADPVLARPVWKQLNGRLVDVIGVVFPEETAWRQAGLGWLFHVRTRDPSRPGGMGQHLIRAGRAGPDDLAVRAPAHLALRERRVAVAGLGALGAPTALELARAGVGQLHLLDHDFVDPGTISRWPFGIGAAGMPKTDTIGGFLSAHYPLTTTLAWTRRLGQPTGDGSELELLGNFLGGVDLVYDSSAEIGVQHLLSDLAWERSIPYVAVSTTFGARGGLVAAIRPGQTAGCWLCLQHALDDGTIEPPPSDPEGHVQPVGCASPTFTGAGYDTLHVALAGVRAAVAMLLEAPPPNWDVLVMGNSEVPTYVRHRLDRHRLCDRHGP
jgi:hypothetical protein